MKIKALAEDRTKRETIEHLVEGIKTTVPVRFELTQVSERYRLKSSMFTDLRKAAERFLPQDLEEYLLILTHSPFTYVQRDIYDTTAWVGRNSKRHIVYAGFFIPDDRVILVGGDNFQSDNNVRLAVHEVGHIILNPIKGEWTEANTPAAHCDGYIGDKRCIMNTQQETVTKEFLEELYLGFCPSCTEAIKDDRK